MRSITVFVVAFCLTLMLGISTSSPLPSSDELEVEEKSVLGALAIATLGAAVKTVDLKKVTNYIGDKLLKGIHWAIFKYNQATCNELIKGSFGVTHFKCEWDRVKSECLCTGMKDNPSLMSELKKTKDLVMAIARVG